MSSCTRATLLMSSSCEVSTSLHPADRLVGDAQALEDLVVEAVLAEQQRVDDPQEVAGLGALDDPVVVGAREREDLADGVAVERLQAGAVPLGGVLERADADDRALALHQARHRVHGADGAGVGQRDRGALEVLDGQLAAAGLLDHLLVGGPEVGEVHRLGGLDRGHEQLAGAVGLGEVDGQAEVDVGRADEHRLAPLVVAEAVVHLHADRRAIDPLHQSIGTNGRGIVLQVPAHSRPTAAALIPPATVFLPKAIEFNPMEFASVPAANESYPPACAPSAFTSPPSAPIATPRMPVAFAPAASATAPAPVACVAVPMAMELPPFAVVSVPPNPPVTVPELLPMAMLPWVWVPPAVVACPPSAIAPLPVAMLAAPLAVL